MIQLHSLEKTYASKKGRQVKALKGISLELPDSGLVFILGKSGSGKSTLLNLLGGLDRPTGGEIVVDGKSSRNFRAKDFDAYRNEYVGFVFQEYDLLEKSTAGANVALALEVQGKEVRQEQVDALFRELELTDDDGSPICDRQVSELSGGQKQRVAIARALIKQPRLVLADEPTGALDCETGVTLYELFKKFSADRLVVVVTHDKESAEQYGDRIIELRGGQIASDMVLHGAEPKGVAEGCAPSSSRRSWKLPFKLVLAMGLAGLQYKKFRLAVSVLLAVISLSVFGFSLVSATTDPLTAELQAAYDAGVKTVLLVGNSTQRSELVQHGADPSDPYIYEGRYTDYLLPGQIERLKEYSAVMPVLSEQYSVDMYYHYFARTDLPFAERYNPYNYFGRNSAMRVVELDPLTGEQDACLRPDPRLTVECRLPRTFGEIALTDYLADMFIRFGYKDVDGDGATYEIAGPDDLIGKTIQGLTVCGVYATGEDKEWFRERYDFDNDMVVSDPGRYSGSTYISAIDDFVYTWMQGVHPMKYAFVCEGYYKNLTGRDHYLYEVLYNLSGSIAQDKALLQALSYTEEKDEVSVNSTSHVTIFYSATIKTSYAGFVENTSMLRDELVLDIARYIGIAFAAFSALQLMSFLLAGVEARKKEIGILRALGVSRIDVARICLAESLFIALIDFLLAMAAIGAVCIVLNAKFYLSLFKIGAVPFFSVLLLCLGVAVLATVLPVIKIIRKKPIEIINRNR